MARDLNFPSQTPPPRDPHRSFSTVLIALICFLGGCFLLVSYYAVLAKYCSKRRQNQARPNDQIDTREDLDEHNPTTRVAADHPIWLINTTGLDQTVISSIPIWKFKESEGLHLIDVTDCSVCLSEFEYGESLRVLPKCGHAFHVHCIDAWLSSHTNCPLCRAPIAAAAAAAAATPPQPPNLSEIGWDLTDLSDLGEMEETQETRIGVLVGEEEEEERIGGVRRAVSMDSQSIFGFSTGGSSESGGGKEVELELGNLGKEMGGNEFDDQGVLRLVVGGCSSFKGLSPQNRNVSSLSMKRSLSSGGRFWFSRCRRSNSSIPRL